MRAGRFITFEGGEGTGKSTQVRRLAERLREAGQEVVLSREPGGSPGAEAIRRLLVHGDPERWTSVAETLLLYAARSDHLDRVIRPALERGDDVLCDRYVHSSLAYQGVARGLGLADVEIVNRWATDGLWPDLVVLLDVDPEIGLNRVERANRFEGELLDFHEAVARAFRDLAERDPDRFLVVDAAAPTDQVAANVAAAVLSRLAGAHGHGSG